MDTRDRSEHVDEIVSLNADDLVVEELEDRLEMLMASLMCQAFSCPGFGCPSNDVGCTCY